MAAVSTSTMPFDADSDDRQLYTKRNFIQVNNGDKIVRLVGTGDSCPTSRKQQRLIRLIPLEEQDCTRNEYISRQRTSTEDRPLPTKIHIRDHSPRNHHTVFEEYYQWDEVISKTESCVPIVEKLKEEKAIIERELQKARDEARKAGLELSPQQQNSFAEGFMADIQNSLQMLLRGQQNIDYRLDSLQKEHQKDRKEIEDGLMNIMKELKHEIAGKSIEHSQNLDRLKQKQERLYNEFNVLFLRLNEMEHLVSNLLRETKDGVTSVKAQDQKSAEIQELAKSESLQSVLSISSGSYVEGLNSQEKRYRKPARAFLFSQNVGETQKTALAKGHASEVVHL